MRQSTDLPAGPLLAKIEAFIVRRQRESDVSADMICDDIGLDYDKLKDWRSGKRRFVSEEVATRVLDRSPWLWWDVWGPQDRARCGVSVAAVFEGETEQAAA